MRNWKKIMAGALSICLLANCVPNLAEVGGLMQTTAVVHAETKDVVVTGEGGDNATWSYNRNTRVMTITGTGIAHFHSDSGNDIIVGRYKKDVKKLVFSDGITAIGDYSFENFTALEEIQFGGVKKIGYFAFSGCTSLKALTLAENIEVVGVNAFSNCKNLTTVTVGSKLNTAYWDIFEGCDNLTSIEIDKNNTYLYTDGKELLNAEISGTCGENVKYAYDRKTKTLTLSGSGAMFSEEYNDEGGTYMGWEDYDNFLTDGPYKKEIKQQMENLVVGDKVTSIGKCAFADCKALKSVKIGKKVGTVDKDAFKDCTALQSVKLGNSTKIIESRAFSGCSKLKEVSSVTNLTKIGSYAFYSCKNLKSFTIGKSLSSIGESAFFDCARLTQLSVDKQNKYFSKRGNMLLSKDQSKIVSACFGSNKTCNIYGSVKSVKSSLLADPQIKKYSVSKSNTLYASKDGLLYSKDRKILYACPAKKTGVVNIDDTVTSVKGIKYHHPFEGCKSISQINIGKNVKEFYFGYGTMAKLAKIKISDKNKYYYESNGSVISKKTGELLYCYKTEGDSYTVPDSVKKIGEYSFAAQNDLKKIVLSDSVTEIDCFAFWDANDNGLHIESIHLGKNYVNPSNRFFGTEVMDKLKEISVSNKNENYSSLDGCLYDKKMKTLLVCPYAVETYKIPDGVVSINQNSNFDNIKELSSNDRITDLTDWLERCHRLQTLHIGKNVLTVKNAYLPDLSKILVDPENKNFKSVDDMLYSKDGSNFIWCPSQKEGKVVLEDGVTTISENAFKRCTKITDIVIPNTVTKVENNIFGDMGNDGVESIVIWVPAGKGEYYKSLFTKETGFEESMLIMELEQ